MAHPISTPAIELTSALLGRLRELGFAVRLGFNFNHNCPAIVRTDQRYHPDSLLMAGDGIIGIGPDQRRTTFDYNDPEQLDKIIAWFGADD